MVPEHYHEFKDVFDKENFDEPPPKRLWDHAIELLPGDHIVDCKTYNLMLNKQKELDTFSEENLKLERICPSKSPFTSAFFFIKKKKWKIVTGSRLSKARCYNSKKSISFTINLWTHWQAKKCEVLYKVWYQMGIQQYSHERRRVEGSFLNKPWIVWTLSNVLWAYKFSWKLPNHDEFTFSQSDQLWKSCYLHTWTTS